MCAGYSSATLLLSPCGVFFILEQQNCFSSGSLSGSGLFSRGAVASHWQKLTEFLFFSFPLQFGIHRAVSALHTARVVLSVGEILQSCCFNHTDKVSRPLPRGGESWCDGAFSKSRVRQGAGKGQDHDPCCQYCAHMDPFQLLDGETWSSGLTLCLER